MSFFLFFIFLKTPPPVSPLCTRIYPEIVSPESTTYITIVGSGFAPGIKVVIHITGFTRPPYLNTTVADQDMLRAVTTTTSYNSESLVALATVVINPNTLSVEVPALGLSSVNKFAELIICDGKSSYQFTYNSNNGVSSAFGFTFGYSELNILIQYH